MTDSCEMAVAVAVMSGLAPLIMGFFIGLFVGLWKGYKDGRVDGLAARQHQGE